MIAIKPLKSEPNHLVTQRRAMVNQFLDKGGTITLNGKPASVLGYRLPFPFVAQDDVDGERYEFSWPTVKHVLAASNGRFKG